MLQLETTLVKLGQILKGQLSHRAYAQHVGVVYNVCLWLFSQAGE